MWFRSLWDWFTEGVCRSLAICDRVALGCNKQSLMGDSGQSTKAQNADMRVENKSHAQKFEDKYKESIGIWTQAIGVALWQEIFMYLSRCREFTRD